MFARLLSFLDVATNKLGEQKAIEVCNPDSTGVFDSVDHRLLLLNMGSFCIYMELHPWAKVFLGGMACSVGEEDVNGTAKNGRRSLLLKVFAVFSQNNTGLYISGVFRNILDRNLQFVQAWKRQIVSIKSPFRRT